MFVVNLITFIVLRKINTTEINTSIEVAEPSQDQLESEICDKNTYTPEQYVILKQTGMNAEMWNTLLEIFGYTKFMPFSNNLCNDNYTVRSISSAIGARSHIFHCVFVNRNGLGIIQRNRSRFRNHLSFVMWSVSCSHKCITCISNAMATIFFGCKQYHYSVGVIQSVFQTIQTNFNVKLQLCGI